jgi:PAS domain S-box-containing protein
VLHDNSGKPVRLVGINVDITERKQVLKTLRESEARFRSVLDSSRDFIYRTDVRTGRYEYISPSVRAVMGFSPDELMSMGHQGSLAMIHPDDLPVVHAWLARLEDTGEGELEYRLRGGDGKFRWLSNHASITKDSAGRPLYRNGSVRDITERKRVEATLRESEEINRITFEQAAVGISHVAPDGTWLHVNQKLCDIVGYTREELLKMHFQEITHPDDRAADHPLVAKLLAGEIETYSLEKRYIRKDHTIIWINLTVSMVRTASGEPRHSISITEDITQRKRAEAALEKGRAELDAALASMTDAVFISDATGQFINFNDAFASFHKFRNKAECARKLSDYPDFLDVFTANGQLAPLEMWAVPRALRGETVTNAEYRLRRKDTGETWIGSYSFSPIRDNHGAIVGSVVVGRDITEKKRAEEALRESELRYRLLFENNMDAIFLTKAGGKVIAANPAACVMFDTTEEAFCRLGRQWTADPNDPRLAPALEERARTGRFKGELTYIRPNGTRFIGEVNSVLLPDGDLHFAILRDITDRKRGEQALRESEERLRSMGDNLPESYVYQFTHDADGSPRFLYLSAGVEKLHGVSADDVLRDANVLHRQIEQEQLAAMVAAEAASLQTLTDFQMELRMCRSDGQWRWFHLRSRPRRKPDGRFLWDGVATDITERKWVQEKLRESEVLYHSLFNSMVEAFCIVEVIFDPDGKATDFRFLEVNPAFEKQTGLHEPVGKRMSELVPSNEAYWCEIYGKIALTGEPAHFDNEAKALNRYYEVRAYRVGEPELRQVAIVFNDISGRKRTEQALRESEVLYHNLFNSMDEGFCIAEMIFDSEGKPADYRFLEVNAAFENQTGIHDGVGKRMLEIAPSHEAYWFELYGKIALTGEPAHFENEAKALDRYYDVSAYRVGEPELRHVAIVFNDISGRKRTEKVLHSALEEKTALLKEVHHRVKNNLQIVSSLLNLQVRGVKNDAALEALRDTQGRIRAMALLHETLYRESNAGRVNCSIYFSHLCAHLCRAFGQMGERVRVRTEIATVELSIDVAIPCGLIINELVSNSFKHAFPDGRRGEIMIRLRTQAENRIVLSVCDDGIGLPPGADYQQNSTLGANLVTGLAKQIAGTLEVKSDHGTTVQINFVDPEKGRPLS